MSTKKRKYVGHSKGGPPKGHKYNENRINEGGRPRKWDGEKLEELADRLDEWIDHAIETKSEFWWQDWAFEVGLYPDKIAEFSERNDRFRRSYIRAKQWQAHIVQRFALTKKFSEGFSKFFLINRYSDQWKDKAHEAPQAESNPAFEKIMEYLEKNQSSALNNAESNNNSEEKS